MILTVRNVYDRKLIFEGNSLFNYAANSAAVGGQYIPVALYNAVRASASPLALHSFALSGRNQTQINSSIAANITPIVRENDVIVLWEGTNDMYTNDLSGADAYANLVTYANTVRALGAKLVICTVIARDYASDDADLMTRIGAYNTLVRDNQASICDALCDLAADPLFDARADASNTTYYNADKIHQATAGQDRVITLLTTAIESVL